MGHCYCRKGQFIGADLPLVLLYWQLNMEERSAEWIQNIEGYSRVVGDNVGVVDLKA